MSRRRTLALIFLTVGAFMLVVFIISLIRPVLPQNVSSFLLLLIASLLGVSAFLAALNDIIELVNKVFGDQTEKQPAVTHPQADAISPPHTLCAAEAIPSRILPIFSV